MVSTNQIPGFLKQPFLQNKSVKQCNSFHVDTKSQKLKTDRKVFGRAWSKKGVANLFSGL